SNRIRTQHQKAPPLELLLLTYPNNLRIASTNMSYSPVNPAVGRRHAKLLKPTNIVTARVKLITAAAATILHLLQHVLGVKIMRTPASPGDFTTPRSRHS